MVSELNITNIKKKVLEGCFINHITPINTPLVLVIVLIKIFYCIYDEIMLLKMFKLYLPIHYLRFYQFLLINKLNYYKCNYNYYRLNRDSDYIAYLYINTIL